MATAPPAFFGFRFRFLFFFAAPSASPSPGFSSSSSSESSTSACGFAPLPLDFAASAEATTVAGFLTMNYISSAWVARKATHPSGWQEHQRSAPPYRLSQSLALIFRRR